MKDKKFTIGRIAPILFSLGLACNANAVKVHINSGNPAYPFPQFMEYACGGNLGTKLADGLTHAEIEQHIRDAYQLHANEFEYTGEEWEGIKYIWTPYKAAFDCTEGDGYALLAAAYMADKTTFDGYWMCTHDKRRNRTKRYMDCSDYSSDYRYGPFAIGDVGIGESNNTAAAGDVDIALALYVAYKQWGEFMLNDKGEKVLDACGNPISYKQELIEVVRGLVALSTGFQIDLKYDKTKLRVNSGLVGLDGYVKGGDVWNEATSWASENPVVFSDSMPIFYFPYDLSSETEMLDVKGIGLVPEFGSGTQQHTDYSAPSYFREFYDLLISLSKELGVTNGWEAEQFRRAEASSDWLMGELIAKNKYAVPLAGWCSVNEDGTETSFSNYNLGEDFRNPWRTISNYVWHGNPQYSWDPVAHKVVDGKNTHEYDAAVRLSNYLKNPMKWNDASENSCLVYGTPDYGINGPKTMPIQTDPMTGIGVDDNLFPNCRNKGAVSFAAIGAQDYDLMGELYNFVYSIYDCHGVTEDGHCVPIYMDGWFRQAGMMALTGNYAAPSQMDAGSNLRIYRSVKDSVSSCRVGDTITYQLTVRNYGSAEAKNVVITETLPKEFALVDAEKQKQYDAATNTIQWDYHGIDGFKSDDIEGAALDLNAPNLAKTIRTITYRCVVLPGASGKYSPVATVTCDNGKVSKTDEYPNHITATMQRNSIDIIPNALSVTKSADIDSLKKDDEVEFTVSFANTDSLPFLTGGRTGVTFAVAGGIEDKWKCDVNLRVYNDAVEPYVNVGNYRVSCFLKTDKTDLIGKTIIAEGIYHELGNSDENRFIIEPVSDGNMIFRIKPKDFLAANTIYCSWFAGPLNNGNKFDFPIRLCTHIQHPMYLDLDFTDSWSQLEKDKENGLYYPVSPSFQNPYKIEDVDKVIRSACDNADKVNTTVLVEEYDGHSWRKILGDAPYNGVAATNVVVADTIPLGFEFVSFTDENTSAKYEKSAPGTIYSGVVTYSTDKMNIGEKGSFSYKCKYVGVDGASVYRTYATISDSKEYVSSQPLEMVAKSLTSVDQIANDDNVPVDVYNAYGQLVKKQVCSNKALDGLSKGVYVVGGQKRVVTE